MSANPSFPSWAERTGTWRAAGTATSADIEAHLRRCECATVRAMGTAVELPEHAEAIRRRDITFEEWSSGGLIGLVAADFGDPAGREALMTSVSVDPDCRRRGIGRALILQCIDHARREGFRRLRMVLRKSDVAAIALCREFGFDALTCGVEIVVVMLEMPAGRR